MNPTLAALLAISVTVVAATLVLVLILFNPVLLQARRIAHGTAKLIDSVRLQVAPVGRDIVLISQDVKSIVLISQDVKSIVQSIHRQVDRVEDGIETVHDMAVLAKEFQWEVKRRIEEPVLELAAVVGGVRRGVEAISSIFSR